jgi:uncharacterized protein YdeI (YjbR/CyaY-like superfamily)
MKRKSLGDEAWSIRMIPRKKGSPWSLVNIRHVERLEAAGLMTGSGRAAFRMRDESKAKSESAARKTAALDAAATRAFRANAKAWAWFSAQAPSYQRIAAFWVASAKQEQTRAKRLATLIADSAKGVRVAPLRPPEKGAQSKPARSRSRRP